MVEITTKIKCSDDERIVKEIKKTLDEIGAKRNFKGYRMWITAAMYVINKSKSVYEEYEMKEVYEHISKRHKSTYTKSERAMRYVLDDLDKEKIKKFFGVPYKITNSTFLILLIDKVEDRLKSAAY